MKLAAVIAASILPMLAEVKITQAGDRFLVEVDGKPFTDFYAGPGAVKPYLHPLRTASGKIVTRMFPMELAPGEPDDHPHHRGLWFTHGDVNGIDFWMNEDSYKATNKGKITTSKITKVESGKKSGEIGAIFEWRHPNGALMLTENRVMTFHADEATRIIDFDLLLTAADQPIKFGDTKEGTFAIRLAHTLQEDKGTGTMVNAAGAAKEKDVWGKQSPWVDYAGEVQGEKVGIAILDHPSNPKHPTYWHSRAYGLFAANPFGEHDFYNDKTKDGSITVKPGESIRFIYRVIIHPGDAASANIAQAFEKFSKMKPEKR